MWCEIPFHMCRGNHMCAFQIEKRREKIGARVCCVYRNSTLDLFAVFSAFAAFSHRPDHGDVKYTSHNTASNRTTPHHLTYAFNMICSSSCFHCRVFLLLFVVTAAAAASFSFSLSFSHTRCCLMIMMCAVCHL